MSSGIFYLACVLACVLAFWHIFLPLVRIRQCSHPELTEEVTVEAGARTANLIESKDPWQVGKNTRWFWMVFVSFHLSCCLVVQDHLDPLRYRRQTSPAQKGQAPQFLSSPTACNQVASSPWIAKSFLESDIFFNASSWLPHS